MQTVQRTKRGFTLVEVIVVAVIVAALAAVSVPLYLNYVTSSRGNAAANTAGSVASFIGSCLNQAGTVGGITAVLAPGGTVTCTVAAAQVSSIAVPAQINVMVSVFPVVSPGSVSAKHSLSPAAEAVQSYSY
jgi:prepilin-type N-terminal cleavage/methylation domain-containing protein